ncbi:Cyclohexanone monooxygenase [Patulibacter medicamentivorans]|uniref:Cyclohexanone monooxygenase n=1 Tax=Patulibacter medicamentivorans TaxID=1097667 RepID=H0E5X4_9ACTN|nr:NAD(P)/FAD-dependent oxidoreductase [Patulibacter medicamentivorans]EHN10915.1 Cyclohexanone monooxygenase [Patulibacter medicamentivorans]
MKRTPTIAIIGGAMSGLCMAAKLKAAGITTFTIYEQGSQLGGTWRDNTYPGLTCDVPSRFYQFRFAPNPDWSRWFSGGAEIWRYFDGIADRLGLREHVELNSEVVDARFEGQRWTVAFADGREIEVDFLISACGLLRVPRYPDIPGLDSFDGAAFHSARWDHEVPVAGRRVGLIGTGSTGAQIVGALGGVAGDLKMFQRTAQWVFPMYNPRFSRLTRALHRRFPKLDTLAYDACRATIDWVAMALVAPGRRRDAIQAICRRHLRKKVADPDLRVALTPGYEPMCKRIVISSDFYPAIQRDDVHLITDGIERVEPRGVRTADGTLHELDVLVLATGFDAHAYFQPMTLTGRDGLTLREAWADGPRGYMTVALPGFPNFFMLMGPHSPVGNYSLTEIAETQAGYVVQWIELWRDGRYGAAEPRQDATDRFNARLREAIPGTVWASGCNSWYLDEDGIPELWAWAPKRHRQELSAPRLHDFELEPVAVPAVAPG